MSIPPTLPQRWTWVGSIHGLGWVESGLQIAQFCWPHDRLAVAKFSKSRVWYKVPERSVLIFLEFPHKTM